MAHVKKPEVIHAVEQVMGLPISEDGLTKSAAKFYKEEFTDLSNILPTAAAFLADQTGMGKTILVLFQAAAPVPRVNTTQAPLPSPLSNDAFGVLSQALPRNVAGK